MSLRRTVRASIWNVPAVMSAASCWGSSATMLAASRDRPLPTAHDLETARARSAADGTAAVGPATEPTSIQVRGCSRSLRFITTASIASAVGGPQR